jgi:hypothetical protein
MDTNNLEQVHAVKFCVKLGEGTTDIHHKIQKAFGNDSPSHDPGISVAQRLCKWGETVEDEPRSERPASVRTKRGPCEGYIRQDRRFTIQVIADELNINECTVHPAVAPDFNTRRVCAKIVPTHLNDD